MPWVQEFMPLWVCVLVSDFSGCRDLVEEERDTLLVTSAQLASQLKEDKHWPVCKLLAGCNCTL